METVRFANHKLRTLLELQTKDGEKCLTEEENAVNDYELMVKQYITLDLRRLQLQHALHETQVSNITDYTMG